MVYCCCNNDGSWGVNGGATTIKRSNTSYQAHHVIILMHVLWQTTNDQPKTNGCCSLLILTVHCHLCSTSFRASKHVRCILQSHLLLHSVHLILCNTAASIAAIQLRTKEPLSKQPATLSSRCLIMFSATVVQTTRQNSAILSEPRSTNVRGR